MLSRAAYLLILLLASPCWATVTQDGNGWTVVAASGDSRIIYVSQSDGNDADNGLSEANAKQTLAAGVALLRSGYPDHLLLKRGDTWTDERLNTIPSGRSADEPILIGTYGTGDRPKIRTPPTQTLTSQIGSFSYVCIIGLDAMPNGRAINQTPEACIKVNAPGSDIIIEDNKIEGYATNISVQANTGNTLYDVQLRRNIIINAWSATDHAQGMYVTRTNGLLLEENFFDHNGWQPDWEDNAVESTGTTSAYTNGDTLTVTTLQYGLATGGLGDALDVRLLDSNNGTGAVGSVAFIDSTKAGGPRVTVTLDLTTGVASNVVAAAIQAFDSGNTFTCTSSGTANLVAADAGTKADVTTGGYSAHPTIFNHNIYVSEGGLNLTFRRNIFSRGSNHCVKLESLSQTVEVEDNLFVANGAGGQWGMGSYDVDVQVTGLTLNMWNNVWTEGTAIANDNSLGPNIMSIADGYMRNNIVSNRDPADGSGGAWQYWMDDHVDGVGINSFDIVDNVFYNLRGPFMFEDPEGYGSGGAETNPQGDFTTPTVSGNTFSGNHVVLPTGQTDAAPLLETQWASSGEMTYSGNTYFSPNSTTNQWFEVEGSAISTETWLSTYDTTASFTEPTYTAATRTATTFATSHANEYATREEWYDDLKLQRNGDWDTTIMAAAVNDYIREGFDWDEYSPTPAAFQTFIPGVLLQQAP